MNRLLFKNYFWFVLTFAIVIAVYLFTLCPSIYLEDSAEYATASYSLGIAHPPGYPLYVLIGKLFTFIPHGTIAWRVNLMSAFFGALTCAFLFLIIQKIFKKTNKKYQNNETMEQCNNGIENSSFITLLFYYLLPFSSALIFAFTQIFWSQSVVAEVYTLNTFFVAVIAWLLLIWAEKIQECKECHSRESGNPEKTVPGSLIAVVDDKKTITAQKIKNKADRLLLFIIFLYGLSLANHQMMLLLAPVFLIFVLWNDWKIIKDYKFIFAAGFLFIIGISLYLYLPIRASQNPSLNWGNPSSLDSFKAHILRKQYGDLKLTANAIFDTKKWGLVNSFFNDFLDQFTIIGFFIILIGFFVNYFKSKKIFFLNFGIFLFNGLFIIFLRAWQYGLVNEYIFRVYYLPIFFIGAIWLAIGLQYLFILVLALFEKSENFVKKIILPLFFILCLFLPVSFLISNYKYNNRSDFWFLDKWARNTLDSMEQGANLMAYNDQPALDSMIFSLMYMQAVEKVRLDIKLANVSNIRGIFYTPSSNYGLEDFSKWSESERKWKLANYVWNYSALNGNAPSYVLYPLGKNDDGFVTRSNGFVYKIYKNISEAKKDININYPESFASDSFYEPLRYNIFYIDLLSDFYLSGASYFFENGKNDLSQEFLIESIKYDTSPFSFNYQAFVEHRSVWNEEIQKSNKNK
jgi:4-amino-4-deoxy-L-arabinose transferase-like glycosyltransferase